MYTIYHIPGVKIGCSTQAEIRVKKQNYSEFEILEEHIDIYKASDREIELQKQYGYAVDKLPYYESIKRISKGQKIGGSIIGKKFGKANGILYNSMPVIVFDKKGNFIGEYYSAIEASRVLDLHQAAVNRVVNNKQKQTEGYIIKYKN